jgi:hypothetical protein
MVKRLLQNEKRKREKLQELGISFTYRGFAEIINNNKE